MYRSKLKQLARLKQARMPERREHTFWVDRNGPTHEEQRDALIASGRATTEDVFTSFRWKDAKSE
jgi:hypothetical protein